MKIVASSMLPACLALACLTVTGGANAEDAAKPLYGAWGIDLTAMDPRSSRAMISIATPQAPGSREHKSRPTSRWLRCAT